MALIITGAENAAKGVIKVLTGALDLGSGVGGVLEATAGLAASGVKQVGKVLAGGQRSPVKRCTSKTKKNLPCKKQALKGKRKCCVHT